MGGFRIRHDEMGRTALQRLDNRRYPLRASEIIGVHKLGGGGIVQSEIKSQRRAIKERLGRLCTFSQPLKFVEHKGICESGAPDRQIKRSVPLRLAIKRQQQSKTSGHHPQNKTGAPERRTWLANEPDADKDGRRSDRAETKESRSAHNREEQPNPCQVEQKQLLSKSYREHIPLSPKLVKPHQVGIRNKRIDEHKRDQMH